MHPHDACCYVHTLPLFRSLQWYAYHARLCHLLAFYAPLHAWLHVHAWVLLASVSSRLQHNEVVDIWSKTYICPPCTPPFVCLFACLSSLLYTCLPVCLLSFLFVCLSYGLSCFLPYAMLAMSIMLICFMPLSYLLCIFFLPLLVCWFIVSVFACTHTKRGRMELGHDLLGISKKGTDTSMSI